MDKNYIESSLKRFLKRKVKITMGFIVAFMIMGTGVFAVDFDGPIVSVDGKSQNKAEEIINIKGNGVGMSHGSIQDYGQWEAIGSVLALNNGVVQLGNEKTQKVEINSNGEWAMGIMADRYQANTEKIKGGEVSITSKDLIINTHSTDFTSYGIWATTRSERLAEDKVVKVTIDSANTIINSISDKSTSYGISAWAQAQVRINNGNVNIKADNVIQARGNSLVQINADKNVNNTVNLDGDIIFEYAGDSGTDVNANVEVNLLNSSSSFTGKVYSSKRSGTPSFDQLMYEGMKLGISNGATWNVTGDSLVNDLTLNGGVINIVQTEETGNESSSELGDYTGINDSKTVLNVDNLNGNGGIVTFETKIDGKELKVAEGNLRIRREATKGANLEVGLSGINTDELAENNIKAETALEKLTNKVVGKDGANIENIDQTLFVDGGTLTGKVTADLENGKVTNIQQAKDTPTIAAIRDLTAINYLSWKQEMSSLSQRMGELRDSSAEHGVWARVYGGKVENGSQYNNEYQTYQVGYDKKYTVDNGRVYLGYLVSYTDGETNYSYGTGENYSVGAGIYATWMNNNGHYVDVLYKVSRLNNKFDMNDTEKLKGDYDTYGISLSAEYGKRFDITDKWFAEPSVGMHLGRLGDETYTTDSGIEICQDSIYTAEGRVGTAVGYKFSDKGNIYARTHVVKEFAGEVDTEYERNGAYNSTSEDFGDTWFEFGVGVNYRFVENMNVYVDVQKTGEATVDNKWQANLGFRYEF